MEDLGQYAHGATKAGAEKETVAIFRGDVHVRAATKFTPV